MPDNKPPNSPPEQPTKTGIVQTDTKGRSAKKSIGKKSIREMPPSGQSLEKNPELTAGKPSFISQNEKTVPETATPISEAMRGSSVKTIEQPETASGQSQEPSKEAELAVGQPPNVKTAEVPMTTIQVSEAMRGLSVKTIDQAEKAFDMFFDAASRSLASIPSPRIEISKQALSFTAQNVQAVFDHACKLAQATDLKQVMQIQSDFLKNQFTNVGRHMEQMFGDTAPSTTEETKE